MKDDDKIECAVYHKKKSIWIPPNGRPYWTHQNRSGNSCLPLTNKQLKKCGLSQLKKYPYSKVDAIAHKLGNFEKLTIWEDIYVKWKSRKNIKWTWNKIFTKWERTIPRWVKNQPKK